ncbi:MAG: hypothetical protein OSB73_24960, partial [Candidatus Latescibacteria bacterium]|nr:hypothetical protein [Candidatus Latescibacterota bacterium]
MRMLVGLVCGLSLVWIGCGDDTALGNGNASGDCESNVLAGDYTIRSAQEAIALERKGGCNYTIAGNLEI